MNPPAERTVSKLLPWALWLVGGAAALGSLARMGFFDLSHLARGTGHTARFLAGMFPPSAENLGTVAGAMVETLQIAYVGTLLGFAMALPAALLATPALFRGWVTGPLRLLLAVVRTIPALLWALIFAVAFGFGPMAGTLGVAFYTLGYLGKLYYETFEGADQEVLEAVRSVGCTRIQLMRYAVLPESANALLSQLLFIFEYNVRASTILGFVGAGGIGFYLRGYVEMLQYRNLTTALLATLAVVLVIEQASKRLRRRFLPAPAAAPA